MTDAEVPVGWSQLATDIMVSKYFRKAGVPQGGGPNGLPSPGVKKGDKKAGDGPERSARQVIHRLAGCWRHWGETHGYFDTAEDAQAFYDELVYMMVHQMAAPNSPQWFNTGLHWAYGISGPAQGHWIADPKTGEVRLADDAYTHPQPHACFIQSVSDDLVNEGGIMDLWTREARLFKYGSGTGTNFSHLRAENEPLSGGGKSSGLMSWLRIGDRAAGAIKSGGTTRRAAKMVCLDMDHPDIGPFINWKVREEIKVAALVEGMKVLKKKDETIAQTADRIGLKLDYDFNGEAYQTVSGQNSNNSVRIPDEFFDAIDAPAGSAQAEWKTFNRTDPTHVAKTYDSKELWNDICYAAWRCADPGVQFDSTINAWHTCPSGGRINASNPCSEYMFLDDTACNLASINLLKFYDPVKREFDVERYEHAIDVWTIVLEISVLMASFPSRRIAELSYRYRTLGLGYANLGAMLMQAGIAYDSEESMSLTGCLSAILTGRSYRQSALLAGEHGPFAGFADDKENMLRVMRNHRRAAHGVSRDAAEWEDLRIRPLPIDHETIGTLVADGSAGISNAGDLLARAVVAWDEAVCEGEKHGYRNAQVTVIAPTGTIGLLMDCDTTGIEPDFALVKFKKLAGGGYFKIANASVEPALLALGYSEPQVKDILTYLLGAMSVDVPMPDADGKVVAGSPTFAAYLRGKGLIDADIEKLNKAMPGVFEAQFAFNAWTLGDEAIGRLGFDAAKVKGDFSFNLLRELGLTKAQLSALNELICGTQTVEGAPHLLDEHLPVFDCANKCGKKGTRFIAPHGHIRAMAAAQPFISGAISKTINLPNNASIEDIAGCYRMSWELGLKANALYRDGCKLSQPLNVSSDEEEDGEEAKAESKSTSAAAEVAAAQEKPLVVTPSSATATAASAASGAVAIDAPAALPAVEPKPIPVKIVERPMRRRLPDTRASITHKFNIAGHEGYLTVGLYENGMPGELFVTMAKEGSTIGGLMDSIGTATSVSLQYGVPLESLVRKFTHQRFEPAGMTTNADIPFAKSLVDYIFRWLGMEFIPGYREANAPVRSGGTKPSDASKQDSSTPGAGATKLEQINNNDVDDDEDLHAWSTATAHGRLHVSQERSSRIDTDVISGTSSGTGGGNTGGGGGGGGAVASVTTAVRSRTVTRVAAAFMTDSGASGAASLSMAMEANMGDAPACDVCGAITVRNGTCYKCMNCGNSMGCS